MKKIAIIFLILILMFQAMISIVLEPLSLTNSIGELENSINASYIAKTQECQILKKVNNLDGFFTENRGQIGNDSVKYYIQGKGVWFLEDGVVFEIREEQKVESRESESRESKDPFYTNYQELENPKPRKSIVLKLTFEGANAVGPKGRGLLPHKSNFFYGNDSSKWCTNVPNYQEIIYENLYDSIDLRYYSNTKGLKYDFIIHPSGDPNEIRLSYKGAQQLCIDSIGNLKIKTQLGDIVDSELFIYQDTIDNKNKIEGNFKMIDTMTCGFEIIGKYDKEKAITIDPLVYSTFIGGSNVDYGYDIEIDSSGNAYVTGQTWSSDFPTTPSANDTTLNGSDIFVLKLNSIGSSLIYSTFIGGPIDERGDNIAIDSSGNAYVTGFTWSFFDFPTTAGAYDTTYNGGRDCVVLKLNSTGSSLVYSTLIGGGNDDYGRAIEIDPNGDAYVTGITASFNFPKTSGANDTTYNGGGSDGFVVKLNSSGSSLIYSTFIGGSGEDKGSGITIDSNGNAYVTGNTGSLDFPTTPGANDTTYNGNGDIFALKLNSNGSLLVYSTYIGGSNSESNWWGEIVIDSNCNAYVSGKTNSSDFPTTSGAYDTTYNGGYDGFMFKLNSIGSSFIYSTFVGGCSGDIGIDIAVDLSGNAYVTGSTGSPDFPIIPGAYNTTYNNFSDGFVIKLNSIGSSLVYSTFIGGSGGDGSYGIVIDSNGFVYVTGDTYSADFPTTPGAFDTTYNGYDVFVLKLNLTLNRFPSALDLKISDPTVLRTNSVYLYSNATDFEDLEQNLTPFFEYRDQNEQVWNKTYFSNPQYNNSRWEVSFTPPKNADLGIYDFRVRFNDTGIPNTGWLFSNWCFFNDSLTVLNNIPLAENLFLSNNTGKLGDTLSIWINGSDVEEPEEHLTIKLEYRDPNEQSWNTTYLSGPEYLNDRWEYSISIPFDAPFGFYDFKVQFKDRDNDFSQWLYANNSLLILNLRPEVIDLSLSKSPIYRTESTNLYVNGTDHETPETMLRFYAQYKHKSEDDWTNLTGEYLNNSWKINFITDIESILGFYDFRVKFEDNESASSGWVYLNDSLEVLNNLPVVVDLTPSKPNVYRTDSVTIQTNGYDIENPENLLTCELQYKSPSGIWTDFNGETYVSGHWEVSYTPSIDAELGYYDLRVNFTDLDDEYSGWTTIEDAIEVKNNLPIISELCDNFEVGISQKDIDLTQYESDIEDSNEDLIWSIAQTTVDRTLFSISIIDISEDLLHIIPVDDASGSDDITLILTDNDGGCDKKSDITIYINSAISPSYRVSISVSPELIEIEQGKSENITLTVTNKGNMADYYAISFESDEFSITEIKFSKISLSLGANDAEPIKVMIIIPEDKEIGEYKIKFIAKSDIASDNTTLTITVKEKDHQELLDADLKPSTDKINDVILIILIIIIILTIISSIFIGGTEIGKYKFLSLFFVPLYNRLHHDQVLDNFIRGQIYGYIKAKPGEHYNAIKNALELNNGTFVHHVRILEKEGYVYSKRDGLHTRFYPKGAKITYPEKPMLNDFQKSVIDKIRKHPGIAQHEIVTVLGANQQTISYNLTKLTRDNLLYIDQQGREKRYYINYDELPVPQPQATLPIQSPQVNVAAPTATAVAVTPDSTTQPVNTNSNPTQLNKNQK